MVESARERAERLLAGRTRFVLNDKEWKAFTAALERPAETIAEQNDRPSAITRRFVGDFWLP
jgi:uncharacterized protein (DUF1778 family)